MLSKKFPKKLQAEIELNKKYAVGYRRVSDEKQRNGASLETQKKTIENYCKENNLILREIYEDKCISGLEYEKREGFLRMLKEIKPGMFILSFEVSRLGRDAADNMNLWKDLVDKKGCTIICLSQNIDSRDKSSELIYGIQSLFAGEESKKISDRTKANMNRLAEEGKLLCRPGFGYKHDPNSRRYIPDDDQQKIVEQIKLWYLCGVSLNEISRRLNDQGSGKVLNNNKKTLLENPRFYPSTISLILRNYGVIKDDKTPDYTYPERVEKWNSVSHEKKRQKDIEPETKDLEETTNIEI